MAKKLPREGQLVRVMWVDSADYGSGWTDLDGIDNKPASIESAGWVRHATSKAITLVSHMDEDAKIGFGVVTIPWCAVEEVLVMGLE